MLQRQMRMKYAIIILDGAAGPPEAVLGDKTPLQAARLPTLDSLASAGRLGTAGVVAVNEQPSDADVFLSILGYDPMRYAVGEGVLTAKARGIAYNPDEIVFCCDFVTVIDECLHDPTAGLITDAEVQPLIASLNQAFGDDGFTFCGCSGHRALCRWKPPKPVSDPSLPSPASMLNQSIQKCSPKSGDFQPINNMLMRARLLLGEHEINHVRQDLGENIANAIWLWGAAPLCMLPGFPERHHLQCCLMEQNDILRGIGKLAGVDVFGFPEADVEDDSYYATLGDVTADAIDAYDIVASHLAAPRIHSLAGKIAEKVHALELIDRDVLMPVLDRLQQEDQWRILVISGRFQRDRRAESGSDQLIFVFNGDQVDSHRGEAFDEENALQGEMRSRQAHQLMEYFIHR